MPNKVDYTGRTSGRLVAIRDTGKSEKNRGRIWEFHCDCGNIIERPACTIFGNNTQSCGCVCIELCEQNFKAGHYYKKGHKGYPNTRWRTQLRDQNGLFIKASTRKRVVKLMGDFDD